MPAITGDNTQPQLDPDDLADLNALSDELHIQGCTAHLVTEPGRSPCLDVRIPGGPVPGPRIYAQAGTYFWHGPLSIAPTSQPATAAALIFLTAQPLSALTLHHLQHAFPDWHFWHDDGQDYARRPAAPEGEYTAQGDSPADLLEAIQLIIAFQPQHATP